MEYIKRIYFIAILALATVVIQIKGQLPQCPADANSCCQCVAVPGCTWLAASPFGDSGNSNQSRCVQDSSLVGVVNELTIGNNRPFNTHRKRYIRPESANLEMSIGLRKEISLNVMAKTRRVKLLIVGPIDVPTFSIEKGDSMSCTRRFRVRERILGRRQRKLIVDCHVSAAGGVQKLKLVVDMNKCYKNRKEIRVNVRERGSKKFKLHVRSSCSCPCQSTENSDTDEGDSVEVCEQGEPNTKQCTSDQENNYQCQNDNCRREQNELLCGGHGTCICGECQCDYIAPNHDLSNRDEFGVTFGDDNTPGNNMQRYTGSHCECDDTSCPIFNNLLCGGTERGVCTCGQCRCRDGFGGEDCGQSENVNTCTGFNDLVCGGNGDCVSGQCFCNENYMGQFCEECLTCPSICNVIQPCVMCQAFDQLDTNNNQVNCTSECEPITATFHLVDEWPDSAELCATVRHSCYYEYSYRRENGEVDVYYKTNSVHCTEEQLPT